MPVTKSWTKSAVVSIETAGVPRGGFVWLVCASVFVAAGLTMAYAAKSQSFAGAEHLVNVNAVQSPEELLPLLESVPDRQPVAEGAFEFLDRKRPLPNIGA